MTSLSLAMNIYTNFPSKIPCIPWEVSELACTGLSSKRPRNLFLRLGGLSDYRAYLGPLHPETAVNSTGKASTSPSLTGKHSIAADTRTVQSVDFGGLLKADI